MMRKRARLVSRAAASASSGGAAPARPTSPSRSSSSSDDGGRLSDTGRASSDEEEEEDEEESTPPARRPVAQQDVELSVRLSEADYMNLYVSRAIIGNAQAAKYCVVADPRATNASLILKAIGGLQAPLRGLKLSASVHETDTHFAPTASGCVLIFNAFSPRFATLFTLDLSHAPVGDSGLRVLGLNIRHLVSLQFLLMNECQLGKNPSACTNGMRELAHGLNTGGSPRLLHVSFGKNELSLPSLAEFVGYLKFRDAEGSAVYNNTTISFEDNHVLLQTLRALPASPVTPDAYNPRLMHFAASPNPVVQLLQNNDWTTNFVPGDAPVLNQLAQRNGAAHCWEIVKRRESSLIGPAFSSRQSKRVPWTWAAGRATGARAKAARDAFASALERFENCQVCMSPIIDRKTRRLLPMRRYNTCCHGCCAECAALLDSETHTRLADTHPELCTRCQVDLRIEPSWAYSKTHATHGGPRRSVSSSCGVCVEPVAGLCEPHPLEGKVAAVLGEGPPRLERAADRELEDDLLLAHGALEETREGLKRAREATEDKIRGAFDALRRLLDQREAEVLQSAHEKLDKEDSVCADHQANVLADLSALYLAQALRTTVAENQMSATERGHMQFWLEREKVRLELAGALGKLPPVLPYLAKSVYVSQVEESIRKTHLEWSLEVGLDDLKDEKPKDTSTATY